ncbi:MAG: TIGR03118 family protein [Candidatus Riflebacteria bacterium]|nr:TIGR03118 family protein [Candidatus Riflebacteria bacterium]
MTSLLGGSNTSGLSISSTDNRVDSNVAFTISSTTQDLAVSKYSSTELLVILTSASKTLRPNSTYKIELVSVTIDGNTLTSGDYYIFKTEKTKTFSQTNLIANSITYGANLVDSNLANAWGIALNPNTCYFWISSNHSSTSVVYDSNGTQIITPVRIPSPSSSSGGAPSGQIYNSTQGFIIQGTGIPANFIFVGEDGVVSAWNSGTAAGARSVVTATGVYKGVALAADGGANFLYAANFNTGKIDVYDSNFNLVTTKPFVDTSIPTNFAPFNIKNLNGLLYVSYLKQNSLKADDVSGAGNGYIDIFNPNGALVKRFVSQGALNSPWGMVPAPANFGDLSMAILVGNFGDGKINTYDISGNYIGQLKNVADNAITIDGL